MTPLKKIGGDLLFHKQVQYHRRCEASAWPRYSFTNYGFFALQLLFTTNTTLTTTLLLNNQLLLLWLLKRGHGLRAPLKSNQMSEQTSFPLKTH